MKRALFLVILSLFTAAACAAPATPTAVSPAAAEVLTVFAAASLKGPLDSVIADYGSLASGVNVIVNYGGSGALQTQIEQGAPVDIFFPAGSKQMDALAQEGLIDTSTRIDLLKNEIVLIVPKDATVQIGSFVDAASDAVTKIALGDPKSVPVGQYAQESFTWLGLWDKVSSKAIYASDVKQVLSWVSAGNAECGVVYKTDAMTDQAVKAVAEAPNGSHAAVVYPVAVVKASSHRKAAAAFMNYLQSEDILNEFLKTGFSS